MINNIDKNQNGGSGAAWCVCDEEWYKNGPAWPSQDSVQHLEGLQDVLVPWAPFYQLVYRHHAVLVCVDQLEQMAVKWG